MVLVDLNGAWPSWDDIGKGFNKLKDSVTQTVDNAVKTVKCVTNDVKEKIGAALAIGATTGAAMGVSTRAATDIVLRQNSSWQEYVGDGIGGAVAGITTVLSPGIGTTAVGMMAGGTAATTTSILKGDPLHKTIINTIVGTTTGGVFGKIGARGNQAIQRVMATYLAYKTPSAIYNMLIQELGDFLNNHVEQCMEGS